MFVLGNAGVTPGVRLPSVEAVGVHEVAGRTRSAPPTRHSQQKTLDESVTGKMCRLAFNKQSDKLESNSEYVRN